MRWVRLLAGVACISVSGHAWASDPEQNDAPQWVMPTHIQMVPLMLPVGNSSALMTVFLEPTKRKRVEAICRRIPRVRDALFRVLSRKPIPVRGRKVFLDGVEKRLMRPLNRAVGKPYIGRIYITPGAVKLGDGKIRAKKLAVFDDCETILKSDLEKQQIAKRRAERK